MDRDALLNWYDENKRDLPWRRTRDPYSIWVSEIMCQQTRVETVIPYYEKFLARFPTAAALADADEDDVMSMWSGLGYYRRARLLQKGAREVVVSYGGEVPEGRDERLKLPGIGRYTAGAIGSIAWEKEEGVVDGNVMRVFARHFGIATPLGAKETDKRMWKEADALVRGPRPGDLNQAIMELGARVCRPRSPTCLLCPIAEGCVAKREGTQDTLPVPKKKKPPKRVNVATVVACRRKRSEVLLVKQERALFGGLYMTPALAVEDAKVEESHGRAALAPFGSARIVSSATVEHVLSHRVMSVSIFLATHGRAKASSLGRFVPLSELHTVGVATLTKKILRAVDLL